MEVLKNYAKKKGIDYGQLMNDFSQSSAIERDNFLKMIYSDSSMMAHGGSPDYEAEHGEIILGDNIQSTGGKDIASGVHKIIGRTHDQRNPNTVNGTGEDVIGGDYVFSARLSPDGVKSFAQIAEKLAKDKAKFEEKTESNDYVTKQTGNVMVAKFDAMLEQLVQMQEKHRQKFGYMKFGGTVKLAGGGPKPKKKKKPINDNNPIKLDEVRITSSKADTITKTDIPLIKRKRNDDSITGNFSKLDIALNKVEEKLYGEANAKESIRRERNEMLSSDLKSVGLIGSNYLAQRNQINKINPRVSTNLMMKDNYGYNDQSNGLRNQLSNQLSAVVNNPYSSRNQKMAAFSKGQDISNEINQAELNRKNQYDIAYSDRNNQIDNLNNERINASKNQEIDNRNNIIALNQGNLSSLYNNVNTYFGEKADRSMKRKQLKALEYGLLKDKGLSLQDIIPLLK
jgi:hypothetical protein